MNPTPTPVEAPVHGFTLAAGNLVIRLGYRDNGATVTLFATTQVGASPPQMWRQFEAPKASAVGAAERLVIDATEYAYSSGGLIRPSEDLDFRDFVEHLSAKIQGELH